MHGELSLDSAIPHELLQGSDIALRPHLCCNLCNEESLNLASVHSYLQCNLKFRLVGMRLTPTMLQPPQWGNPEFSICAKFFQCNLHFGLVTYKGWKLLWKLFECRDGPVKSTTETRQGCKTQGKIALPRKHGEKRKGTRTTPHLLHVRFYTNHMQQIQGSLRAFIFSTMFP